MSSTAFVSSSVLSVSTGSGVGAAVVAAALGSDVSAVPGSSSALQPARTSATAAPRTATRRVTWTMRRPALGFSRKRTAHPRNRRARRPIGHTTGRRWPTPSTSEPGLAAAHDEHRHYGGQRRRGSYMRDRRPPTADLLTARLFRTADYPQIEDAIAAARDAGMTWADIEELTGLSVVTLRQAHRQALARAAD